MTRVGTIAWFARHEGRLAWRDWLWLISGGRRRSLPRAVLGLTIFAIFLHGVAYLSLARSPGIAGPVDKRMLVLVTGMLVLYGSLMLSQAMEAVTRAFYGRADLDLILSSPVDSWRLFAVRIAAMAASIVLMSLALAAPFINVLAWIGGARWLSAYGVVAAMAMAAVAVSVAVTATMFATIGPRRTRSIAQVVAAVIGAGFVIGLQFAAISSIGTVSRIAILQSPAVIDHAPDAGSLLWWPARAVLGDLPALAIVIAAGAAALGLAICRYAPQFERIAADAGEAGRERTAHRGQKVAFRPLSVGQTLRRKEWVLLRRDPWLLSQSLMQLLYLLPAAFLLWRSFSGSSRQVALLAPVLIMAAGQLAGGLAWLAISGEDAPDLIASAPVPPRRVMRVKAEAVAAVIAVIFAPFVVAVAVIDPLSGASALAGIALAAASATLIQFWFRAQAKRSQFRRRQVSSRVATIAEALSSITWAGAGALAALATWLAAVPAAIAVVIVAGTWVISPARSGAR